MPSSDQSSGAGSVAESKVSVISDIVKSLEQAKDFLSRNRPVNINSGNNNGDSGNDGSSHTSQDDFQRMENQAEKLSKDLIYIKKSFESLKGFEGIAIGLLEKLKLHSSDALGTSVPNVSSRPKQLRAKLRAIDKIVMELKLRIPLPYKLSSDKSDAHRSTRGGTEFDDLDVIDDLPVLHVDMGFRNSLAFQDFRSVYESLDSTTKLCLLCFALIPENEIVKKRFMTYWWVGEGFVCPKVEKAADGTMEERLSVEEVADGIFKKLAEKDCIEPVNEKHRFVVDSYKMNPFIRSAVILLAKETGLFDFDDKKWNPTTNFKTSHRAYLVNGFSQELVKFFNESATEKRSAELDLEKLQTIFNVNEPYPDFFKSEWFSKLKNVKVLYLGRWQTSAKHHIEVESVEFLKGLKNMKLLRFFSLQGISRITKLPDSVCKLLNLRILDLRACHTLEELPDGIGSLENLTHLDISECYLLEYIPKKIKWLSELRVLKGFVIGDRNENSCTLADLSGLEKLRKLSIYTNTKDFPSEGDANNFQKFKNLEKLTIEWGAFRSNTENSGDNKKKDKRAAGLVKTLSRKLAFKKTGQGAMDPKGFQKLKKLDLKCYPSKESPSWLLPAKLPMLEKLYIRGGNLQNLRTGQENDEWKVNVLRLKFLSNLKMDWKELQSSFPELIYLEKYKCPKLTFFPCNENGIVLNPKTDAGRRAAARYNIVH